jgi:outer membrane lipoprotein SlyB
MKNEAVFLRIAPLALAALMVVGCSSTRDAGSTFSRSSTQQVHSVQRGVVQSVRVVTIERDGRNTAGAVTGAVVGSAVGGPVATVGGAAAGSAIQNSATTGQGLEITVLLDNGQTVAIVQEGPLDAFRAGDNVNVTSDGSTTRVSRR